MTKCTQWKTEYGPARRNDQLEGYLRKKIHHPLLSPLDWHDKYVVLTRLEVCNDISVTVPALIMNPEKARGHRLLNLDKMLEAKCIGARQFVISMPDRQWRFKAASDKEAAVWVACIKEVQSHYTWYVDKVVLKTPIFPKNDKIRAPLTEKVDYEVAKICTLELYPCCIVIRDVLSDKVTSCLDYGSIHSFQANHSLFWIATCACSSAPASLHVFTVTAGETATLALLQELKDTMVVFGYSDQAALLPPDARAPRIATVTVNSHAKCAFPRCLSPLRVGRLLCEGLLPMCKGVTDLLCITRRTGNSALLCGYVPRDYMEKYSPKGRFHYSIHCDAQSVHTPPFVLPRCARPPIRVPRGAEKPEGSTYLCLSSPGVRAIASPLDDEDSYIPMKPVDRLNYLELLPDGVSLSFNEPDQAGECGTGAREGEVQEDCGCAVNDSEDSVQE